MEIARLNFSGPDSVINWLYDPRKSLPIHIGHDENFGIHPLKVSLCEPQFTHLPNDGAGQNDL